MKLQILGLLAVLVFAIVKALKLGQLSELVPASVRPWVALSLGILGSFVESVVNGTPYASALAQGLLSASAAMAGHDLISTVTDKSDKKVAP